MDDPEEREKKKLHEPHGINKTRRIQITYLIAVIVWVLICVLFGLHQTDFFGIMILLIPIGIFFINFVNAPYLTVNTENNLYSLNYVSVGLMIIVPLITLTRNSSCYRGNRDKIIMIVVMAMIFAVLSVLNVWVRPKWVSIVKHIHSVFRTYTLTLLLYALYIYYRGSVTSKGIEITSESQTPIFF